MLAASSRCGENSDMQRGDEMAMKKTKTKTKTKTKKTAKAAPVDLARTFSLAGLGVASIARKQGGELLSDLIVEGKDVRARTQKLAKEFKSNAKTQIKSVITPMRANIKKTAAKFSAAVQQGVAVALAKLGIPSKADVEELTRRVAALSRQLKTTR
jgi:poly(hydroxyalkanoate) granule-associated protein